MSVTAANTGQSRNGCPYCDRPELRLACFGEVKEWVGCYWTHCTSCHSRDHNACLGCGECLGDYEGAWVDRRADTRKRYRIDKEYCSNACRQKTYRERVRTAA
jgi:hypothetical protein